MKKILIVINNLGIGGAERVAVDEIKELVARGFPVLLLTLRPEKENSFARDLPVSVPWEKIHFKSLFDISSWRKLTAFLRRERPDLTVSHLWFANTIMRIARWRSKTGRLISFEQNVYDTVKTKKQFFVDRLLQRFSTKIIAVSVAVKKSLLRHGIRESRIDIIPNSIDISRFQNISRKRSEKHPFTYLFAGRLIHQKGVDVLLHAFAHVPEGALVIAGQGPDRERLEELTLELGIAKRVSFIGVQRDMSSLFARCDCFVFPSRYEGMPLIILEALASGKAVISSSFEAAREIIEDGVNGIIVPAEDEMALAGTMKNIQADPSLRRRIEEGALSSSERFSIGRHIDSLLAYLPKNTKS